MKQIFAVTGAGGHLGGEIARQLIRSGHKVRILLLGSEPFFSQGGQADIYHGDVTSLPDVRRFLERGPDEQLTVIHCAGIVYIEKKENELVRRVNVGGTKNLIIAAAAAGARLVYVSSVHALPVLPEGEPAAEVDRFDPDLVVGCYAKTKALASQAVLESAARGSDALIVQPSGIIGPYGPLSGNMTNLAVSYLAGRLPAAVAGGYDFVDVRDVAAGTIKAALRGKAGRAYLLTNRYVSFKEYFRVLAKVSGRPPLRHYLPLWAAEAFAPLQSAYCHLAHKPLMYTSYSLYTVRTPCRFSSERARKELGYTVRPLEDTLRDLVGWIYCQRPELKRRL